jgi:hypothetical protein
VCINMHVDGSANTQIQAPGALVQVK